MIPTLTRPALIAAIAAALVLVTGWTLASPLLSMAGQLALAGLALAYLAALPKVRAVRKERLEFVWRLPSLAKGVVTPGVPVKVKCRLRHRT